MSSRSPLARGARQLDTVGKGFRTPQCIKDAVHRGRYGSAPNGRLVFNVSAQFPYDLADFMLIHAAQPAAQLRQIGLYLLLLLIG